MVVNFIKENALLKIIKESDTKKDLVASLNSKGITYIWEGKNHIGVFVEGKGYSIYKLGYKSLFDSFCQMNDGEYYVSAENLAEDVQVGDIVTIWFNGMIQETYPAQLGVVYRIIKTQ